MAGRIVLDGFNPALDSNGKIDDGATLTFYENGTTTLQTVYAESDLLTPLDNPLSCNAAARYPDVWCPDGSEYTLKWELSNGDIVTRDKVRATVSNAYDLPVFIQGQPASGETFPAFYVRRRLRLVSGLTESGFTIIGTAPAAPMVFTLNKNGSEIGTITFGTDKVPTISFPANVDFELGDMFTMDAPDPQDTDATNIVMTFVFEVL